MSGKKDLAQIIRDNPGCVAIIDNDAWSLHRNDPDCNPFDEDYDKWERWSEENTLARSDDDLVVRGDGGYGSGNCYGGDILQALAAIVGVRVQSV